MNKVELRLLRYMAEEPKEDEFDMAIKKSIQLEREKAMKDRSELSVSAMDIC